MNLGLRHSDENWEGVRQGPCKSAERPFPRLSRRLTQLSQSGAPETRGAGRRLRTFGPEGNATVFETRTREALGLLPRGGWRVRAEGQETDQMGGKRRGGGHSKTVSSCESREARESAKNLERWWSRREAAGGMVKEGSGQDQLLTA